ncbi:MAG: type 1 glutamine amidotransferase [Paracoccus sp. (in: a-proteobacteria)]|nr:type 1 glutamine amidotransferase [Paracoccus sp. (in: a-proteobacteria)]
MKIGILQCGQAPESLKGEAGDYPDMFVRLLAGRGFEFSSYHVEGMEFPASVHDADGWLLTGSRHGAYEDHPFIPPLEAFIRDAYAARVPLIGICFGHQIIAQALGGKVEKYAGGWSVGAQDYDFDGEVLTLNAWHQDQVTRRPDGAERAASSGFCENAALIYPGRAFTVQAHPEFGDDFIRGLMETRAVIAGVPASLVESAGARMGGRRDSQVIAQRIVTFLHEAIAARQGTV